MTFKVQWNETTEDRFDEMLGCVPPAIMAGGAFLVGEAYDFRMCRVTLKIAQTFQAFAHDGGKFLMSSEPITIAEFKSVRGLR